MENFIEQAKALGFERGYAVGFKRGYAVGFKRGYAVGFERGQAVGFEKGQASIHSTMFNNGMNLSNISKITENPVEKLEEMVASKSK